MSNIQRTVVVGIILLGVTALVIVHYSESNLALAVGLYGTILGYTFGRTNGEKALATQIIQAQANASNPKIAVLQETHNVATSALGLKDGGQ